VGTTAQPRILNLGCGSNKLENCINVDAYGEPDFWWDLNIFPYPWADNSVDGIEMWHVLEHLDDWWSAFLECARILKPGGYLHVRVPDESSSSALTYRDHLHVFSLLSFHGVHGSTHGASAWAQIEQDKVPFRLDSYAQVPYQEYEWMVRWCPWLLRWCAKHLRNFIWEQRFRFIKIAR
jgi:SAM-dependent methyltransferase